MDKIRQNILREQEIQKARLNTHFDKAFSANGTVNKKGRDVKETSTESVNEVHEEIERQAVIKAVEIDGVEEAFDTLSKAGTEDIFEKAKHQDGDMHPNGKWVWVASANGGKGDWRTHGGRAHSKAGAAGGSASSGSGASKTTGTATQSSGNTKEEKKQENLKERRNRITKELKDFMHNNPNINNDSPEYHKKLEEVRKREGISINKMLNIAGYNVHDEDDEHTIKAREYMNNLQYESLKAAGHVKNIRKIFKDSDKYIDKLKYEIDDEDELEKKVYDAHNKLAEELNNYTRKNNLSRYDFNNMMSNNKPLSAYIVRQTGKDKTVIGSININCYDIDKREGYV